MVAPECVFGVAVDVNRLDIERRTGNLEDEDDGAVGVVVHDDVVLIQQVYADFLGIVCAIPKGFPEVICLIFCEAVGHEAMVLFHDAEYNNTTCGIGESRVGLPETAGEAAFGSLELNSISLFLAAEAKNVCAKILHS